MTSNTKSDIYLNPKEGHTPEDPRYPQTPAEGLRFPSPRTTWSQDVSFPASAASEM